MDVKKIKKNLNTIKKLQEKAKGNPVASEALDQQASKLNAWCEHSSFKPSRCPVSDHTIFEVFSKLLFTKGTKFKQCKTKLFNYLNANSNKFDAFLQKYTEFDDYESYVTLLNKKSVDPILELVCLCSTYQKHLKILYYNGEALKEKTIHYCSRDNADDNSPQEQSDESNQDYLLLYLCEDQFIPLLPESEDDSDGSSSEKSTELVAEPVKIKNKKTISKPLEDSDQDNADIDIYNSMNKFMDDDFDTKLTLSNVHKSNSVFGRSDHHGGVEPFFTEIWNKPTGNVDHAKNAQKPSLLNEPNSPLNISRTQGPPGLAKGKNGQGNEDIERQMPKKKNDNLRAIYQKGIARSDEQAFNFHMRQQVLTNNENDSLIEEEAKSTSNLNLSTSSRAYKPGITKSKSIIYSNESHTLGPNLMGQFPAHFSSNLSQSSGSQYMYHPSNNVNVPMHPPTMMGYPGASGKVAHEPLNKGFPPQYNYPMGVMSQHPMYPQAHQGVPFVQPSNPALLKQAHSTSVFTNSGSFGADKMIEVNREDTRNRHSYVAPTAVQAMTTASSSNLTSGSASPPVAELKVGTGLLKFFNQQHQYGFIISEKDGSDIFFHYDDVKHTQLSKEFLRHATENYDVRFSFQILDYVGKYESSKKAVNINLLSIIARNTDI